MNGQWPGYQSCILEVKALCRSAFNHCNHHCHCNHRIVCCCDRSYFVVMMVRLQCVVNIVVVLCINIHINVMIACVAFMVAMVFMMVVFVVFVVFMVFILLVVFVVVFLI